MLKYIDVANRIESTIKEQKLAQGTKLPSLMNLCEQYQVSKTTMVKALASLEQQGVIFQVQGSGIFVRLQKRPGFISLTTNSGFTHDLSGYKITSKTLELTTVTATSDLQEKFECPSDEPFYFLKRLRYIDDQVLCIENSYFRQKLIPYLNREIVEDSVFGYIQKALNLKIGFSDKFLRANTLNTEDAELLSLPPKSPGFFLDELFYSNSGVPFDLSQNVYNFKHAKFFMQSINK